MLYPEREPAPVAAADRMLRAAAFNLQRVFARRLLRSDSFGQKVRAEARRLQGVDLAGALPALRYRVRRAGFTSQMIVECFGVYCAALAQSGTPSIASEVLAAARWLLSGGVAELARAEQRLQAVALAGFARALVCDGTHILTLDEAAARALATTMQPAFAGLGLDVGCVAPGSDAATRRKAYSCHVACVPLREAALDYLRDRVAAGGRPGAPRNRIKRLAGGRDAEAPLTLNGLHGALVLDADLAMLDEARAPVVIAREVDRAQERLMYEQAMELARALRADEDFHVTEEGVALSESAAALLGRLATPMGGLWAAAERREELVRLALEALHALERDVDYRVDQGRVLLPPRSPEDSEVHAARDAMLQMLIEVKEGCRTSTRREIVARISVPAFLRRYLHLGGVCADARGLEAEFWSLYGLKTALAGVRPAAPSVSARVFATTQQKQAALLDTVRAAAAAGKAVVVAVRSPAGGKALEGLLADAGIAGVGIARYPAAAAMPEGQPVSALVAELHDARRHVAHLCTVHGVTHCRMLLALDEEPVVLALGGGAAYSVKRLAVRQGELPARLARLVAGLVQRRAERAQAILRQEVASRDQYLRDLLAFSGEGD